MARRRSRGIARISASRNPISTSTSIVSPSSTTSPMAVCQEPAAGATWYAITAFSPIPGASAMGKFAPRPIISEVTALAAAVAATTGSFGIPAAARMAGLAKRM